MSKADNVIEFYMMCNKLKTLIRTGWIKWHVQAERLESVAEHIYSTQMLAIAMYSEYGYDIDIYKVILMLAIHELEEILIGDITIYDSRSKDKLKLGHEAIEKVLSPLCKKEKLRDIILEFDNKQTPEAKFVFMCDKVECQLQCKMYDIMGACDTEHQEGNNAIKNEDVKKLLNQNMSWSNMWLSVDRIMYQFDENFSDLQDHILKMSPTTKNKK